MCEGFGGTETWSKVLQEAGSEPHFSHRESECLLDWDRASKHGAVLASISYLECIVNAVSLDLS